MPSAAPVCALLLLLALVAVPCAGGWSSLFASECSGDSCSSGNEATPLCASVEAIDRSMLVNVRKKISASGKVSFPAAPALVDEYVAMFHAQMLSFGVERTFSADDLAALRATMVKHLEEAFAASHCSWVTIEWKTGSQHISSPFSVEYTVTTSFSTVEDEYASWVSTREPPLFGTAPDAMFVNLARSLGEKPADVSILDVGAGTGRNTLPLARAGFRIDALELAPALSEQIASGARNESLAVGVVTGSFYDRTLQLPQPAYKLILLAETCSHWRGVADLQKVFVRLSELLEIGGIGLMNVFVASPAYTPTVAVRQVSELTWCPIFTRADLSAASSAVGLELVQDVAVYDYEHEHQPAESWPPTSWFADWTRGFDLFDLSLIHAQSNDLSKLPMHMRWLSYRRIV